MTFVRNVSTHFKEDFNDIEVMKWNSLHKLILLAQDDFVGLNITLNTKRGPPCSDRCRSRRSRSCGRAGRGRCRRQRWSSTWPGIARSLSLSCRGVLIIQADISHGNRENDFVCCSFCLTCLSFLN